jgi:hypothetical protein
LPSGLLYLTAHDTGNGEEIQTSRNQSRAFGTTAYTAGARTV